MHELRAGDLAFWLNDDRQPVRCRVELVTAERVYLRATTDDLGIARGTVWYESLYTRRVAPRNAVYVRQGKAHFDWNAVRITS